MRYSVLGAGMVGRTIARDLASDADADVVVFDRNPDALRKAGALGLHASACDLSQHDAVCEAVEGSAAVVTAVPGYMGLSTLSSVIESGTDVVDIAFMPEDPGMLDPLAREKGVTAVVDFGVAPGLSHVFSGKARSLLDNASSLRILVGGLPRVRKLPWEYVAPFSPVDVLEEYTRPARVMRGGAVTEKAALSEVELVDLPGVGTLEAFVTDGLRSLLFTIDCPEMVEKTLRYPGYAARIGLLAGAGFLSREPVEVGRARMRPLDLTSKLLFKAWEMEEGCEEFTVMRVEMEGMSSGRKTRITFDLYDEYDKASGTSSMSRTTGFPAAAMARMLARKAFVGPGIVFPESVGMNEPVCRKILSEVRSRGVSIRETVRRSRR